MVHIIMSYETENRLPPDVTKRQAIEFAELLGYKRSGTYRHLGRPDVASLHYFEEQDYRSWTTIELSIHPRQKNKGFIVATRTRIGRSHYDFAMQNRTVLEFKKRFGGTTYKDGGNGEGYDPGPAIPPPASGCKLALNRLDWNLSRINLYLYKANPPTQHESEIAMEKVWPGMREINPDVFGSNILIPYITSLMEDYFKSTYIALLKYSENKASILKSSRIRGDQLVDISVGKLTVEEAFAELLPFHLPSNVGQHFRALESKLDILAPLRRTSKRNKISMLDRLDALVQQRHALIHDMQIDINLTRSKVERLLFEVTESMARIYKQITKHYGWPYELPMSSNFTSRKSWYMQRKLKSGSQKSSAQ